MRRALEGAAAGGLDISAIGNGSVQTPVCTCFLPLGHSRRLKSFARRRRSSRLVHSLSFSPFTPPTPSSPQHATLRRTHRQAWPRLRPATRQGKSRLPSHIVSLVPSRHQPRLDEIPEPCIASFELLIRFKSIESPVVRSSQALPLASLFTLLPLHHLALSPRWLAHAVDRLAH